MITDIPDRERALQAEVDELREGVKRYKEMADMASAEIAALTAELARLRALLTRTIDHVSYGSRRSYDGVGGYKMREAASQLLLEIMAALAALYRAAPPAQPAEPDQELPGMWEPADLSGGATDCLPAEPVTKTAPPPVRCPVCNGNDAGMSCPRTDAGVPGCLRDARMGKGA